MTVRPELIRNIPSITAAQQAQLARKRVLIAGCGGLGGYLLEYMVRMGLGHIRIADGDVFDPGNRNRQLLSLEENLGQSKVLSARQRALAIAPEAKLEVFQAYITAENSMQLVQGCDAVLDGLDNVPSRRILCQAAREAGVPYVYGAVEGWTAQAALFLPEDSWLDTLYPVDTFPESKSTLSFTPGLCAAVQASLCLRFLLGEPVSSGVLYRWDLRDPRMHSIALK